MAPSKESKKVEEVEIVVKEEFKKKYVSKVPTKEILESIVSDVLKDLGFKVEPNKKLRGKRGGEIEVDVWAWKKVGNTNFYVYSSCKNWNREVDRSVIAEEIERISG